MINWRLRGQIIRTIVCFVLYDSCTYGYINMCDQFLNLHVGYVLFLCIWCCIIFFVLAFVILFLCSLLLSCLI